MSERKSHLKPHKNRCRGRVNMIFSTQNQVSKMTTEMKELES